MPCSRPLHALPLHALLLHALILIVVGLIIPTCARAQTSSQTLSPPATRAEESSNVERFADAIVAAKTEDERQATLAAHVDWQTAEAAQTLAARGERLRLQGENAAALNLQLTAFDINTRLRDEAGMARTLDYIGRARHGQNDYKAAIELYEQSLAMWMKLGGANAGAADAYGDLGRVYYALRDYDKAQACYEKGYAAAQASGNKSAQAVALNGFGIVSYYHGEISQALEFYKKCLRLCEEIGDQENLGNVLNNIALVRGAQGDYRQAIELQEKTIKLYEALGARRRLGRTYANLSNMYNALNDQHSAIVSLQKSIAISEALDDKPTLAMAMNNTGYIYYRQGNHDLALHYFQKGLALREAAGVKASAVPVMNSITDIYRAQGRYAQALEMSAQSLAICEAVKDKRNVIATLEGIGDTHLAQGAYAAARENYEKALTLAEQSDYKRFLTQQLTRLGAVSIAQGEHAKALAYADRAVSVARQLGTLDLLWRAHTVAGQAQRGLHKYAEAEAAFTEAIEAIEGLRGQVIGGERAQQGFLAGKLTPYSAMIELTLEQGDGRAAFALAERTKARVLLDVLRSGRLEINKALTPPEREREHRLSGEVSALNEQLTREQERDKPDPARLADLLARQQKTRLDYEALQANLYVAHPELAVQRGEARPVTLEQTGALVPDTNTALIEYVVAEDRTLLFVITRPNDPRQPASATPTPRSVTTNAPLRVTSPADSLPELHVFTLNVTRAELTTRAARFHQRIATRDILFAADAQQLYQTLLAPAAELLQNRRRLIIVPDGALWELPFQALQTPEGAYVVERHAVSYAPSLSVLGEMVKRRARMDKLQRGDSVLFALGNPALKQSLNATPDAPDARLSSVTIRQAKLSPPALPEAERQVRLLAALYGAGRSRVYTGAEAREERVKHEASRFRILQLATHGVLDDASPMYSHVLLGASAGVGKNQANRDGSPLTEAAGEDGLLEAWEMMQLDLQADMVVLSACETARGRIASGEGVIGLTWALFVAGSPTTVVSQWKVESASATELMLDFHRNLQGGQSRKATMNHPPAAISKAEAMRQASLKLLKVERYAHPFYWASFVVIGDGD